MSTFPFDTQECLILYGNLVSTIDQVAFNQQWNYIVKAEIYAESEEFLVKTMEVTHGEYEDAGSGERTCALHFGILLKRHPFYYIVNIILPCALMASVSLLSFVLPPASGERISLQVTVMLSLAVFQLMITGLVPVTSKNTPVMSKLAIQLNLLVYVTWLYCDNFPWCKPGQIWYAWAFE